MKPSDYRGVPGAFVLVRGKYAITLWNEPTSARQRVGVAMPGSIGMIICASQANKQFTYVLWSCPSIAGWAEDGYLMRV